MVPDLMRVKSGLGGEVKVHILTSDCGVESDDRACVKQLLCRRSKL